MSTLSTRPTVRPGVQPKSKVFFVRQPVKSVRRSDMPDRTPFRLWLGVVIALGIVLLVWLMGHLGTELGFAPLVHVPDLLGRPGSGLATGTMILISAPRMIFEAGLHDTVKLMVAFVMIALPAAGLGAAKPLTPGGPRLNQSVMLIAVSGAVAAMLSDCMLIWWTASKERLDMFRSLPSNPADVAAWHTDLQIVAGLDILSVVAAALWVVLVMRLPIPLWLRAIATSTAIFTVVVVMVAMSITNAAAAQIGMARSLCVIPDTNQTAVVIGSTPQHLSTLVIENGQTHVELRSTPEIVNVIGRQSIVGFLAADQAPE